MVVNGGGQKKSLPPFELCLELHIDGKQFKRFPLRKSPFVIKFITYESAKDINRKTTHAAVVIFGVILADTP